MVKILNRAVKLCGEQRVVGTSKTSVRVMEYDNDGMIMRAMGVTLPTNDDAGYTKGSLFIDTSSGIAYQNTGTTAACLFSTGVAGGDVTSVVAGAGMTGGGTAGAVTLNVINTDGKITVGADTIDITADSLMNADINSAAAIVGTKLAAAGVTRTQMSVPAGSKSVIVTGATIATTGAATEYTIAPEAGSLVSVEINPLVALALSDSNYITWTIVNLGQDGAGSNAMLAVVDANTTKLAGTALAINTKRALTVHGTSSNLVVAQGDKIAITVTVTGTLANTVTVPVYILRFGGTT